MTTLADRPRTALLVIDVQNDVVSVAHRRDEVVGAIADLVERARAAATPVVWVQHSDPHMPRDTDGWQIVPELERLDAEPLVHKTFHDSFEDTTLDDVLTDLAVGRLVVTGAQTDWCVRSTLHGAIARGYDAVLVSDAHTTEDDAIPAADAIAFTNAYWSGHRAPGREAGTLESGEVAF